MPYNFSLSDFTPRNVNQRPAKARLKLGRPRRLALARFRPRSATEVWKNKSTLDDRTVNGFQNDSRNSRLHLQIRGLMTVISSNFR